MYFAAYLAVALAFALVFAGLIKKAPWPFYLVALALSALYAYCWYSGQLLKIPTFLIPGLRSCMLGTAFLVVVMYLGALSEKNPVRRRLGSIRAELSVIGAFLCVGHISTFASSYLPLAGDDIRLRVAVPLVAAFVLTALLIMLTATSFAAVKRAMGAKRWKRVQCWAYLFYAVVFFHLMWFVAMRATGGNARGIIDVAVYGAVFLIYAVLRVAKALHERQARDSKEQS